MVSFIITVFLFVHVLVTYIDLALALPRSNVLDLASSLFS